MKLIDADVLLNEIKEDTETVIEQDDKVGSFWLGYIAGLVIKQPTIQPEKAQLSQEDTTKDAISRQAAIDLFPNDVLEWDTLNGYIAPHVARRLIEQLPPAQPEPREGHWIDKGWSGDWAWQTDGRGNCWRVIVCSECGKSVSVESNYCPHCGAKMKGEKT